MTNSELVTCIAKIVRSNAAHAGCGDSSEDGEWVAVVSSALAGIADDLDSLAAKLLAAEPKPTEAT